MGNLLKEYLINGHMPNWAEKGYSARETLLSHVKHNPKLETIIWEATRRCDLHCLHCGTPSETNDNSLELTTSQIKDIFAEIDNNFNMKMLTAISITGGEPTIRNDLPEVVKYLRDLGAPQIVMHTNGHRIAGNNTLLSELISAGITGIGVNIDGLKLNHNRIRQDSASFKKSLLSFEMASDHGIDTMISTVLTSQSYKDLFPLRELILDLNPGRWRLIPIEPIGRAKSEQILSPNMVEQVIDFILDSIINHPNLNVELGCGQWYGKRLEGLVRPYIWHCIAGLNVMGILYDGMISACNNIDRFYCQGSVLEDDIKEVWTNRFKLFRVRDWCRIDECNQCIDWNLCEGGEMHLRNEEGKRLTSCIFPSYISKIPCQN